MKGEESHTDVERAADFGIWVHVMAIVKYPTVAFWSYDGSVKAFERLLQ